jgi:hypothetical protein
MPDGRHCKCETTYHLDRRGAVISSPGTGYELEGPTLSLPEIGHPSYALAAATVAATATERSPFEDVGRVATRAASTVEVN